MKYQQIRSTVHRLVPSRYPTILLFDWAESESELQELALLEGLTNDRLLSEYGHIQLVPKQDWISGDGVTPIMAAFTHIGYPSRFTDGSYGVYYAGCTLETAIVETRFHRERFLQASNEPPCRIQMREYRAKIKKKLIDLSDQTYEKYLQKELAAYSLSQDFGRDCRLAQKWGLYYPSVRSSGNFCIAVFRPPAISIPTQGYHFDYIWNGSSIVDVTRAVSTSRTVA